MAGSLRSVTSNHGPVISTLSGNTMNPPDSTPELLDDGEELLWRGKPRTDIVIIPQDCLVAAVVILVAAICWPTMGVHSPVTLLLKRLTPPFILAFLFFLHRLLSYLNIRGMTYLVTDRRAIIKHDSFLDKTIRSKPYDADFSVTCIDSWKGTTNIYFGYHSRWWDFVYPPEGRYLNAFEGPSFIYVDEGQFIAEKITQARKRYIAR